MASPITIGYLGSANGLTVRITVLTGNGGSTLTSRTTTGVTNPYGLMYEYTIADLTQNMVARWDEGVSSVYTDEFIPVASVGATGAAGPTGPPGDTGPQGVQGIAGTNGTNGSSGLPAGYAPVVIAGPEGSPNGVLAAVPQTVLLAADGSVFVKSLGNDAEGWIQTVIG